VACKPHLQREILSVSGAMEHVDEHRHACGGAHGDGGCTAHDHGPGDEEAPCQVLIPSADQDFRGLVGYLERQVKPYFGPGDPHTHTGGEELLPWFRVMTLSDPHYVAGYTTGAWWLSAQQPEEALAFIEEGVRNNPGSFEARLAKGQILLAMARQGAADLFAPDPATHETLEKACGAFAEAAALAVAQWREREDRQAAWTDYKAADALASARMHVLMESKFGDAHRAARRAREYLRVFGEDNVLERLAGEGAPAAAATHG
jgi:hypothetical protein